MPERSARVTSGPPAAAVGLRPVRRGATLLAVVVPLAVAPVGAAAQTAAGETVRARHGGPDYAPIGIELDQLMNVVGLLDRQTVRDKNSPAASVLVFPKLEVKNTYETNLFRNNSRKHDKIVEVSPSLSLKSDWTRHSISLALSSDIGRHVSNPDEDYEDIRATASGQAEVTDRVELNGQVQLARLHQQRGELLDPGAAGGATIFVQSSLVLGGKYKGDAFAGDTQLSVTSVDYDNSGTTDNSTLNRTVTRFKVRGSYEYTPGTAVFIEPSVNSRNYEKERNTAGFLQASNGWQMLSGISWDVSGVTFAEFGLGYLQQDFDDPAFRTISGPSFSAKLIWNVTDLLTLQGGADRTVNETQDPNASGALVSTVNLRADYALRDNLMLSLAGRYAFEDVEGTNKENDRYVLDLEARYLMNEYVFLRLLGGYDRTISTAAGSSFSNLRAAFAVGAQI